MSNFRVEVNEKAFIRMIESVKHCIALTDPRPQLKYIKLSISKNTVTAYACDGYRAAKTTIPIISPSVDFECYIKPIKVKPSKSGIDTVIIECENDIATVEVRTEYGKNKYCFKQIINNPVNIEKYFQDAKRMVDRKIGVNPTFIKQAANALSQASNANRKCAILETQENNKSAFIFSIKDDALISEQLILPMKINDND